MNSFRGADIPNSTINCSNLTPSCYILVPIVMNSDYLRRGAIKTFQYCFKKFQDCLCFAREWILVVVELAHTVGSNAFPGSTILHFRQPQTSLVSHTERCFCETSDEIFAICSFVFFDKLMWTLAFIPSFVWCWAKRIIQFTDFASCKRLLKSMTVPWVAHKVQWRRRTRRRLASEDELLSGRSSTPTKDDIVANVMSDHPW